MSDLDSESQITIIDPSSSSSPSPHTMYKVGVLVVPSFLHKVPRTLTPLFTTANDWITNTLYVLLHPPPNGNNDKLALKYSEDVQNTVIKAYERGSALCSDLDLRVVLSNIGACRLTNLDHLSRKPDIMIMEQDLLSKGPIAEQVQDYFGKKMSVLGVANGQRGGERNHVTSDECQRKFYRSVCLGGTFDRLHNGHKVLLSQACLVSHGKVTVGVTSHEMHKNKVLMELMEPTDVRIKAVEEFLTDIRPDVECEVLPITDPFGPTIHRPEMDCLVVSQETLQGGRSVNEKRKAKGFPPMDLEIIDLVEDAYHTPGVEEQKLSSTSGRKRMLAKLLRKRKLNEEVAPFPFVIGMTGGIASGKSSVSHRLSKLGAAVVDCDKLGHLAYVKGSDTQTEILRHFGEDLLTEDGEIDRKKLGAIVFNDQEKLKELQNIVWPKIRQMALDEIQECRMKGTRVVILDAAVLLEAGWDNMVHEVWVATLPVKEAVRRVMHRDSVNEESARRRVESQLSDEERVAEANVVLSTLWSEEVTQRQVEKAWTLLQERLEEYQASLDMSQ